MSGKRAKQMRREQKKAERKGITKDSIEIVDKIPQGVPKKKLDCRLTMTVDLILNKDVQGSKIEITVFTDSELAAVAYAKMLEEQPYSSSSLKFDIEEAAREIMFNCIGSTLVQDLFHELSTIDVVYTDKFSQIQGSFSLYENGNQICSYQLEPKN